jgi:hypothetical protein
MAHAGVNDVGDRRQAALPTRLKTTHTVEVDFKPSASTRRLFRRTRRNDGGEPFNPTLLAGIAGEPNRGGPSLLEASLNVKGNNTHG